MLEDQKLCQCSCASLCALIIGSFRKHLTTILRIKQELEKKNVLVLSPSGSIPVNKDNEFIIFESDYITNPRLLQDSVFAKIKRSTFVVIANVDGYIGRATMLEIGYAIASNINIYSLEPVSDLHISTYCRPLDEIVPEITRTIISEYKDPANYIRS